MIRVAIGIPEAYAARAEHVFRVFADQWGLPVRFTRDIGAEDVDICYGLDGSSADRGVVRIRFDERLYHPACRCAAVPDGDRHLWSRADGDPAETDIVAGAHRLLTFLDEQRVDPRARDGRGVFLSGALPAERLRVAQLPVVDDHAAALLERLRRTRPAATAAPLPKWPGGKRYAVALTHDTDAISLGASKELATNLVKLVVRRDRRFAGMLGAGLRYAGRPTANPLFGFPRWREYQSERRLRSCFYLYARVAPIKRNVNNCKSSVVEQRIDWDVLRRMVDAGWEFGVHAPINAKDSIDALSGAKRWLEQRLGSPIHGLRHHYWALDWVAPHTTWRKHVNSGFRYDASIAWRDITGFRAATCHPFRPFDPERGRPLELYELPTCVMDGHVMRAGDNGAPTAAAAARATLARVKERGGVAVLDWHTESACDSYIYEGSLGALDAVLDPLLQDGDAWFAAPWEIVEHWHRRRAALDAAGARP